MVKELVESHIWLMPGNGLELMCLQERGLTCAEIKWLNYAVRSQNSIFELLEKTINLELYTQLNCHSSMAATCRHFRNTNTGRLSWKVLVNSFRKDLRYWSEGIEVDWEFVLVGSRAERGTYRNLKKVTQNGWDKRIL